MININNTEHCPKHGCGFWGIPLEKLDSLKDISDDKYECCLWHDLKIKCVRDPRFTTDAEAQDCFDLMPDEIQDEEDD